MLKGLEEGLRNEGTVGVRTGREKPKKGCVYE